ncbi:unnamed protein product [Sphenostylis stenocarpa]|uniref:Uncharacterized protein n=1 Tax=Sphenostylis stenocarpa TaxID=92480 RepID=A0AA86W5V3_9FABA|nr:unnamed protein product [Sphenostylis stenocarpa]
MRYRYPNFLGFETLSNVTELIADAEPPAFLVLSIADVSHKTENTNSSQIHRREGAECRCLPLPAAGGFANAIGVRRDTDSAPIPNGK